MNWINENAGILVLIVLVVAVLAFGVVIAILINLRSRIAVQRLKLIGFYSKDAETRENYAVFTMGNKSLNDVGVAQLGLRNGRVNFDLTSFYKLQAGMSPSTRIVIEQRSAITFRMTEDELSVVLLETPKGQKLSSLKLYVVDLTGNVYYGRLCAVRHLLSERLKRIRKGLSPTVIVTTPTPPAPEPSDPPRPSDET